MIWKCKICGLEVDLKTAPSMCESCGWDEFENESQDQKSERGSGKSDCVHRVKNCSRLRVKTKKTSATKNSRKKKVVFKPKAKEAVLPSVEQPHKSDAENVSRLTSLKARKKQVLEKCEKYFADLEDGVFDLAGVRTMAGRELLQCIKALGECENEDFSKIRFSISGRCKVPILGVYWTNIKHGFIFKRISRSLVFVYNRDVKDLRLAMTMRQLLNIVTDIYELSSVKYVTIIRDLSSSRDLTSISGVSNVHLDGMKYNRESSWLDFHIDDGRRELFS